jgi:hypothetical protein
MSPYRKLLIVGASALAVLLLLVAIGTLRLRKGNGSPLGEDKPIQFPSITGSESRIQHFLEGDYELIAKVESLPRPVLAAFTERGGSRPLIANPGKKFEATDYILDASVPRKRLIFAGISDNRCFVHYERGGRSRQYILAFFVVRSAESLEPLWRGSCDGPAANIGDLRSKFMDGRCLPAPSSSL